jgi:hypothetical protein
MATLTHAMLNDLHIGNASLSLLPYTSTGVDITSGLDFSAADQIFTLEGTFNLTSDDPSSNDIRIDQHQEVIDPQIEKGGNWQMTGNIPSVAAELLGYFYDAGATIAAGTAQAPKGVKGAEGTFYTGKGFMASPNEVEVTILAESESKNTAILFPHVKLIVSKPKKDDNTNPAYLSFLGYILPNPYKNGSDYVGDFAVLKATAAPTGA